MTKRFCSVSAYNTEFDKALAELERTVQYWLDQDFSLAGNLIYIREGNWHNFVQPMIGEKEKDENSQL